MDVMKVERKSSSVLVKVWRWDNISYGPGVKLAKLCTLIHGRCWTCKIQLAAGLRRRYIVDKKDAVLVEISTSIWTIKRVVLRCTKNYLCGRCCAFVWFRPVVVDVTRIAGLVKQWTNSASPMEVFTNGNIPFHFMHLMRNPRRLLQSDVHPKNDTFSACVLHKKRQHSASQSLYMVTKLLVLWSISHPSCGTYSWPNL